MPPTLIHHQRPKNEFGEHVIHVFGPETHEVAAHMINCMGAKIEDPKDQSQISDYAKLLIETDDTESELLAMTYLKIWGGGGKVMLRRYDASGKMLT